ncbi:MAG: hypothetical protein ACI4SG_01955 [Oligosphaeraceae bacterium]
MSNRQDILRQIEALEISRKLLDDEIAQEKASLEQMDAKLEAAWRENPYVQDRTTRRLAEYFRTLGYSIVSLLTKAPDNSCYAISKQIWNGRGVMVPFLQCLHQSGAKEFEYPIAELSGTDKTDLLNLCRRMQDSGWLGFRNVKGVLHVRATFPKTLRNFPNGGWTEEANRYLIKKVLSDYSAKHRIKYRVFWDVKLKLLESEKDNLNDMQLDIVAQINDRFYVFETKSGALPCIRDWVARAEIFNQNGNRFITCCLDSEANHKYFRPYRLMALERLETQFTELLDRDFPQADN